MMSSIAAVLLAICALAPASAIAATPGADARREASVGVVSGTPIVLPGLATGATATAHWGVGQLPVFVLARLQWTDASSANEAWNIDHQQFVGALGVGLVGSFGAGRGWLAAGGGAAAVYERLTRHQIDRIQSAGVPGGEQTSLSMGPFWFAELGLSLRLRDPVRAVVAGGPTLTRASVDTGALWRFGGQGHVGVAYDF